jgi:predicted nucleotidyltransferase
MSSDVTLPNGLSPETQKLLKDFIAEAQACFADRLIAAILFGSAAEGRMRPSSDVNLLLVVHHFDSKDAATLSKPLAFARAALRLQVMFLEESEIQPAAQCFAQKFSDILRRHHLLCGRNPLQGLVIPNAALALRLRQVLLNLTIRLRERHIRAAASPEQLAAILRDATGPLRTCAAGILALEGEVTASPKESFARYVAALPQKEWGYLPQYLSDIRESPAANDSSPEQAPDHIVALATSMRLRVEKHL